MSKILFSSNLFLEQVELNRWQKFIEDDGFRRFMIEQSSEFGLIRKESEPFNNALVEEDLSLTVKIREIKAIDSYANFIYSKPIQSLAIPSDNNWYWIKIRYAQTTEEVGVFSIDTSGNLVCTSGDGELTKILRGNKNYPSRVAFRDSVNNILEYDVLEVVDDNNAILQGYFTAESDLKISIVGTFTPGYIPNFSEKYIFKYDSCEITLVQSNTIAPPTTIDGIEFIIGRVLNNGVALKVEDKRLSIWKVDPNYFLHKMDKLANPLIGVEQVMYDDPLSTKVSNIVQVAWSFKATAFSINAKLNTISINSGSGGIFKTSNFNTEFTDGDFDGWRLYTASGAYYKIKTSTLVSGSIELAMDNLDTSDLFSDINSLILINQELLITPDAEEIELIYTPDSSSGNEIVQKKVIFPINLNNGRIKLNVYANTNVSYNIKYRYKHIKDYSPIMDFPDGGLGFYNESQFSSRGVLIVTPTRTSYTVINDGFIPLKLNPGAYSNFVDKIDSGDLLGVDVSLLDPLVPLINLEVGTNRQYQYFGDKNNLPNDDKITLTSDMFINVKKTNYLNNPCKNGNYFFIHIKQLVYFSTFKLRIVTDYIDTVTYTTLKEFTTDDVLFLQTSEQGLFFRLSFDGTDWIINNVNEAIPVYKYSNILDTHSSFISPDSGLLIDAVGYASFTDIPSMSITLPDSTFSKKYQIIFKCTTRTSTTFVISSVRYRLYDTASVVTLDFTEVANKQGGDIDNTISVTSVLTAQTTSGGGGARTIRVQALVAIGDVTLSDLKFSIIEI